MADINTGKGGSTKGAKTTGAKGAKDKKSTQPATPAAAAPAAAPAAPVAGGVAPPAAAAPTTPGTDKPDYSANYRTKMQQLPIHLRVTTKLRRAIERMGEYIPQAARFDAEAIRLSTAAGQTMLKPSELIQMADTNLKQAIELLERIPASYKPERRLGGAALTKATAAGGLIEAGTVVTIREKRRAGYADDLTVAEMTALTVTEIRKNKLVCTTPGGAKVFIPRAHVAKATAEAPSTGSTEAAQPQA